MPARTVTQDQLFLPANDTPISVNIACGATGQQPVTRVYVNKRLIGVFDKATFNVPIGNSNDLKNAVLEISSSIQDLSRATNETSLDVDVTGVLNPHHIGLSQTVQQEGDIIDYLVKITFFG